MQIAQSPYEDNIWETLTSLHKMHLGPWEY